MLRHKIESMINRLSLGVMMIFSLVASSQDSVFFDGQNYSLIKNQLIKHPYSYIEINSCGDFVWEKSLFQSENLITLRVVNCNISEVPIWLNETNISNLDLSGNKITEFPMSLLKSDHLEILNLDHNNINEVSFDMKINSKIKSLFISGNKITRFNFSEIEPIKNLLELRISGNRLKTIDFSNSILIEKNNLPLISCFLDGNNLKGYNFGVFFNVFKNVETLNLSATKISNFSFSNDLDKLQSLILLNNPIDTLILSNEFIALKRILISTCPSLMKIDTIICLTDFVIDNYNNLDLESLNLSCMTNLEILNLSNNLDFSNSLMIEYLVLSFCNEQSKDFNYLINVFKTLHHVKRRISISGSFTKSTKRKLQRLLVKNGIKKSTIYFQIKSQNCS